MTGRAMLNPHSADRLRKLCGMLGSQHDGERAAAAAKADAFVRGLRRSSPIIRRGFERGERAIPIGSAWRSSATLADGR